MDIRDVDARGAAALRKDFLLRIVEQFRAIADEISAPLVAETYIATDEAVLRIDRKGQDDSALRVGARFVDDNDDTEEKLALSWECKGEVTRILGLGWIDTIPDMDAGLDSPANRIDPDSVYAIGKVTRALRDDIMRELQSQPGIVARMPVIRRQADSVRITREQVAPVPQKPTARPAAKPATPLLEPNIKLLQSTLGELATQLGLTAEKVFASFIEATKSAAPLKQGDVATYAQGAILEIALCYDAFLSRTGIRAADLGMERLRHAVVTGKAALFEQDETVRYQFAREMVAGMRLYYTEALASRDVPDADGKEMLKSTFGRDAAIANAALAVLAQPEAAKGGPLRRVLGGKALN